MNWSILAWGIVIGCISTATVLGLMNRNDPKIYTQDEVDAIKEDYEYTLNAYVKEYGRRKSEG